MLKKFQKQAKVTDMLMEFSSRQQIPQIVSEFLKNCKESSIPIKKSAIPPYQINFYNVTSKKGIVYQKLEMKDLPTQLEHVLTVLVLTNQNENKIVLPQKPGIRTLLLKLSLQMKFYVQYEQEVVESIKQGVNMLDELCVAFINRWSNKQMEFFDPPIQQLETGKHNEANVLKNVWINLLFQIPGLGEEKVRKVADSFQTYVSVVKDYLNEQKLKDVQVGRKKLGADWAKKIYAVLLGVKYAEAIM